jgi:hypothetical protein
VDRETLTNLIQQGPVRIKMNNGDMFEVHDPDLTLVSDIAADVLVRGDDGKLRNTYLALVTICSVEPIGAQA